MTTHIKALMAFMLVLAACSGNPFLTPEDPVVDPEELPGTPNPTPGSSIIRYEPTNAEASHYGDGFAQDFTFDPVANTYTVDNLGFDGANGYNQPAGRAGDDAWVV